MNKLITVILLIFLLAVPADAMDFTAPDAPENAQTLMPNDTEDFADGLHFVIASALDVLQPSIVQAMRVCVSLIAVSMIVGLFSAFSPNMKLPVHMVGTITAGLILFHPVDALIQLGITTVEQISQYGKLLLPVMTGALAAQGGITKSGALYTATAFFDAFLSTMISDLLIPIVYVFLSVAIICSIFSEPFLKDIKHFLKWLLTWGLKTVLYIFTGYISITGVVGGTTDAAVLKATKLTISGMVPVVGSILSDASEAVIVSAGMMKSAAGIYGLLSIIAIGVVPFIRLGVQYILLKITSGLCQTLGTKELASIVKDFSTAMGLVLAMTGAISIIFMISTICFMKGVSG